MLIGITGSIASGKSVVSKILKLLDFEVVCADDEAKKLYYNKDVADKINDNVGFELVDWNTPNFRNIADFSFCSVENTKKITDVLYPVLLDDLLSKKSSANADELIFVEAALIFESSWNGFFDKIVCVYAPQSVRYERLKSRNPANFDNCIERDKMQMNDVVKMESSDFVIFNDDTKAVLPQIFNVIEKLKCYESNRR